MRWRLTAPHYLNVPGTEWHFNQVDRKTGKQVTKRFPVPELLNPNEPADWTHRYNSDEGEIIVAWEGKTDDPRDKIFVGPPTPDMVPLDEEAKKESGKYVKVWNLPTDGTPIPDNSSELILNKLQAELQSVSEAANKPAQIEGLGELMAALTAVMKQNAELIAKLSSPPQAVEPDKAGLRRA